MRRSRGRALIAVLAMTAVALIGGGPASSTEEAAPSLTPAQQGRLDAVMAADRQGDPRAAPPGRSVASPFTTLDPRGDDQPHHPRGDITAFHLRNGNTVEIRFWLDRRPNTWNTATTGAIIRLDGARDGVSRDFDVYVLSTRRTGFFAVVGPPNFEDDEDILCISGNVHDLGRSILGYGFSARLGRGCLGGRQGFSARMQFIYSWWPGDNLPTIDVVPNRSYTPFVRPA